MSFAASYIRFRSRVFVWLLFVGSLLWVGWNLCPYLPHFDDAGFERLNLILSIENSVVTSLLVVLSEAARLFAEHQKSLAARQMSYMQHLLEAQVATMERMDAALAELVVRRGAAGQATGGSNG